MKLFIEHTYELISAAPTEIKFHMHTSVDENGTGNHVGTLVLDVVADVWRFSSHECWADSKAWAFETGTSHVSVMCQIEDSYRAAAGEPGRYGDMPKWDITFEDCDSGAIARRDGEIVATIDMVGSPSWFDHTHPEPVLQFLSRGIDYTTPITLTVAKERVEKALRSGWWSPASRAH